MEHYSEHESALFNESHQNKRESDAAENTKNEEKQKKKRRSSFASTRRSISGNVPSKDEFSSDLPSSYGSSDSSQPQTRECQNTGLKPNPLNARMDEIIVGFEENIARLDQEYAQWKMELKNLEAKEEQTGLLSESNASISAEDIPLEIKARARSEYMGDLIDFGMLSARTEKGLVKSSFDRSREEIKAMARSEYMGDLIDFKMLSARTEKGLVKSSFDIRKCLQDMKMFRITVNTIKCHNKLVKASLSPKRDDVEDFDDNDDVGMDTGERQDGRHLLTDVKSQLEWMMNN